MFSRKSLLILSAIFLLAGCQNTGNLYGYDFQDAKITYKITGSSTGTSEVLVKGEKKKIRNQITQKRLDGTTLDVDSLMIQNGEKLYTLDPKAKTGTLVKQPFYAELQKLSPEKRQQTLVQEAIRDNRTPEEQAKEPIKQTGNLEVAGQKCDVYKNGILEICLWHAIPLKASSSLPDYGMQTDTIAEKIELNTNISDSEFDVPSDYQITNLN